MNTSEALAHVTKAIEEERQAALMQQTAADKAGRGDYVGAYEAMGWAVFRLKQANLHRKLTSAIGGRSSV